jgi:hypothetical protein
MNKLILAAALAAGFTLASSTPALAAARNYDCSKPGNANKAACKGAVASAPAAPAATSAGAPAAARAPMATQRATPAAQPGQATAQCKDGSMSHSQHRSGTCANHGGVANWLAKPPA